MKRTSLAETDCPIARALEEVGEWWSLLIVRDVLFGSRRFDQLHAGLGIARNVLANRLATLVEHGILVRRQYEHHPPRFEYVLTHKGRDLYLVLSALRQWSQKWIPGEDATPRLTHLACGTPIEIGAVCQQCAHTVTDPHELGIASVSQAS